MNQLKVQSRIFASGKSSLKLPTTNYQLPTSRGFSMIEMIVYLSILFFVVIFVVFSVLYVGHSYKKLKAEHAFAVSAQTVFDTISREIRDAEAVDVSSTLGTSPGVLVLSPDNVTFFLDNGQLMFSESGNIIGPITLSDVSVTSLVFTKITTANSDAVKVDATLEISVGESTQERNFSTTAVLRRSY